ncbi:MAG: aminoglycoside phosphotransferase family protein [Alphaproteobacteria bacterium]|nr:aminoglycoside phosphotransferase family protein [Alphaproteobacteria bacterium]
MADHPESRWERRHPPLGVDAADVAAAVGLALHTHASGARPLRGGLVHTLFRVDTDAGPVVARALPDGAATRAVETAVLRDVARLVPVPEALAEIASGPAGVPWRVERFVDGDLLADVLTTSAPAFRQGEACGAVLGRLHTRRHAACGLLGLVDGAVDVVEDWSPLPATWRQHVVEALDAVGGILDGAVLKALRTRVDDAATRLTALEDEPVLCHGDFKPTNLLVRDATVTAVLDWEFAWAGLRWFDLGQLLRWDDRYPPDFADGVEVGYRAHHPLPADWRSLAATVDVVNLLGFLARRAGRPRMTQDVVGRLSRLAHATS